MNRARQQQLSLRGQRARCLLGLCVAVRAQGVQRPHAQRVVVGRGGAGLRGQRLGPWAGDRAGLLVLEAQVCVSLHQLGHRGRCVRVPRLRPLLLQAFAPADDVDNSDPQGVYDDFPKLYEAQHGAAHPEPELASQVRQQPDNLQVGERDREVTWGCWCRGLWCRAHRTLRQHCMKRARGTHRCGCRLRDGPVVVLLEVDVQLDDAGPVTQDGSSEQVTLRASHGHAPPAAQGEGSSQPNSRNLCTLRGKAQQRSPLHDTCWGRDVALLLQKHLCTWNLLQGCPLWFFPSSLSWSEASPERRAACAPAAGTQQPHRATAPGRQEPRPWFCPQQPVRAHTELLAWLGGAGEVFAHHAEVKHLLFVLL